MQIVRQELLERRIDSQDVRHHFVQELFGRVVFVEL